MRTAVRVEREFLSEIIEWACPGEGIVSVPHPGKTLLVHPTQSNPTDVVRFREDASASGGMAVEVVMRPGSLQELVPGEGLAISGIAVRLNHDGSLTFGEINPWADADSHGRIRPVSEEVG